MQGPQNHRVFRAKATTERSTTGYSSMMIYISTDEANKHGVAVSVHLKSRNEGGTWSMIHQRKVEEE